MNQWTSNYDTSERERPYQRYRKSTYLPATTNYIPMFTKLFAPPVYGFNEGNARGVFACTTASYQEEIMGSLRPTVAKLLDNNWAFRHKMAFLHKTELSSNLRTAQVLLSQPPKHKFFGSSQPPPPTSYANVHVTCRNPRTRSQFGPKKTSRGTSSWHLRQFAEATLGSGSLRKAVKLPEGEDENEWLAVNVVDFFRQINLIYGSITEFCSPQSCPEMKATDEFEYLWQDSENFKKPTKMPAPEYIEHLMSWCQANIDNEAVFPSQIGKPFPKTFPPLVRQMFKRMFRVYAHIYCHHYPVILQLGLEPHLNTSFKHYVLFVEEHKLATGKDFWGPMGDLVQSMLRSD